MQFHKSYRFFAFRGRYAPFWVGHAGDALVHEYFEYWKLRMHRGNIATFNPILKFEVGIRKGITYISTVEIKWGMK